jgi:hypothetical protein
MKKMLTMAVMIITVFNANAQTTKKDSKPLWAGNGKKAFGIWSFDAGYLGSSNAKNAKESKPLWAANGYSAAVGYRYGDRWGITGRLGYAGGKTSSKNAQTFANTLVTPPYTAKVTGLKSSWSQVNFAVGPSVLLGEKYKGEISVAGGISTGAARNIKVDRYDANTFVNTVYNVTEKKVKPFWEVGASYQIADISKRSALGLKASYGANGGVIGLVLQIASSDCHQAPCFRCPGAGCLTPPTPDPPKK